MRALIVAAGVVLVLAAVLVPLPLVVSSPATLVTARDVARVTYSEELTAATNGPPPPVKATYLAVAEQQRPAALSVLIALLRPDQHVHRARRAPAAANEDPPAMAALLGLGLSPATLAGAQLPVAVDVDDAIDRTSLGAALYAFDASTRPKAQARTVAGIGHVRRDQALTCPDDAQASVTAAAEAGADLVVIADSCDVTSGEVDVAKAGTLFDAVSLLAAD